MVRSMDARRINQVEFWVTEAEPAKMARISCRRGAAIWFRLASNRRSRSEGASFPFDQFDFQSLLHAGFDMRFFVAAR